MIRSTMLDFLDPDLKIPSWAAVWLKASSYKKLVLNLNSPTPPSEKESELC